MLFRHGKDFAVSVIESYCDVTGNLDVLFLVGAHGDKVAVVNEDVSGLEDRVCEQAVIRGQTLSDFVLVACASLQ
ncbi:hypothetical protein ES703_103374 [subsurface metagenome]